MARTRLTAAAVLAVLAVAGVLVAVLAGGGGGDGLRVQRVTTDLGRELRVYVEDLSDNVPATADGRQTVQLECLDSGGRRVLRVAHPWPFSDPDGGRFDPHVHQPVSGRQSRDAESCRLADTRGPLEGRVGGAAPR